MQSARAEDHDSQYGDDRDQDKTEEHLTVMFPEKRIEPLKCSHKSNPLPFLNCLQTYIYYSKKNDN